MAIELEAAIAARNELELKQAGQGRCQLQLVLGGRQCPSYLRYSGPLFMLAYLSAQGHHSIMQLKTSSLHAQE